MSPMATPRSWDYIHVHYGACARLFLHSERRSNGARLQINRSDFRALPKYRPSRW